MFNLTLGATPSAETRTVVIPSREMHEGYHQMTVTLIWKCPKCGGPRGEPHDAPSYDGSRRLYVNGWENPCGHIDYYTAVRAEAIAATPKPEQAARS